MSLGIYSVLIPHNSVPTERIRITPRFDGLTAPSKTEGQTERGSNETRR
jgi:hypothetical protein